ncbi:restriction endonuclease subunit S [Planococcus maritimus]|uniref:restriction endonuclease subunit S n=1 Tax=Planococcus maritimus TaxID=192421 RepID=UPI0009F4C64F|nr:restriction endonuclease subunit S [Planococcus maritimus]
MNEKKLIPKRRFSKFDEEWKNYKLEDLVEGFEYGLNASATSFDGINKYIRITDIDDETHVFLQNDMTSPSGNLNNADNYLLKTGDILFARTGASVGKTYCYDEKDGKVYFAGFLIRARTKSSFDAGFIFQNTLTTEYKNFVRVTSQRSGQPGINAREYAGFSLNVPSKSEQQKTGNFFKHLDQMISLEQRKLEKTKALKSAYLAEMFPAEGERVPKRRFAGFTGEWKPTRLEELAEVRTGKAFSSLDFNDDGEYLVITNKNVQNQENDLPLIGDRINLKNKSIINDYSLDGINVLVTMDGVNIGETGKIKHEKAVLAQRVGRLNSDQIEFVYQITKIDKFILEMNKLSVGNAIKHISLKQIAEYSFLAPILKEEQKVIGEFFKKIDDSMKNQQQKLNKLKAMKQAYLEEMFV